MNDLLERWTRLEEKWLALFPYVEPVASPQNVVPKDGIPKDGVPKDGVPKDGVPKDRDELDLKMVLYGGYSKVQVYPLPELGTAWEVKYAGIKVIYFGKDAEQKARSFAAEIEIDQKDIEGNIRAAQGFLESCENWANYNTEENRNKFVDALIKVKPLSVNKCWAVFRTMINVGELKSRV